MYSQAVNIMDIYIEGMNMKKVINKVKHMNQLIYNFIFSNKTRTLTVKIIIMSAYTRMAILRIPMAKLEKQFGIRGKESPVEECIEHLRSAYWIGDRIERVCDKTIWESKCLVKALIAQKLLTKKGIHTTLYMGVGKESDKMTAHAWLRCGSLYVTGGDGTGNVVVATFYK